MKALIDGDVVTYQCGFASDSQIYTCPDGAEFQYKKEAVEHCHQRDMDEEFIVKSVEPEPVEHCLHSVKLFLKSIIREIDANSYKIFLTGPGQERKEMFPEYKANRDADHKPIHYDAIHEYLKEYWKADVVVGSEADDALAWNQWLDLGTRAERQLDAETCICTVDKDLNMVPGFHYNWRANGGKGDLYWVSEESAIRLFFEQWLTGDSADNIPGIHGWGPATAQKYLDLYSDQSPATLYKAVKNKWFAETVPGVENSEKDFHMIGDLLWMQREPGQRWHEYFDIPRTA